MPIYDIRSDGSVYWILCFKSNPNPQMNWFDLDLIWFPHVNFLKSKSEKIGKWFGLIWIGFDLNPKIQYTAKQVTRSSKNTKSCCVSRFQKIQKMLKKMSNSPEINRDWTRIGGRQDDGHHKLKIFSNIYCKVKTKSKNFC